MWAETGDQSADHKFRGTNKQDFRLLFTERYNLRFLRTCKQINAEATSIFYGNAFRFSGRLKHSNTT